MIENWEVNKEKRTSSFFYEVKGLMHVDDDNGMDVGLKIEYAVKNGVPEPNKKFLSNMSMKYREFIRNCVHNFPINAITAEQYQERYVFVPVQPMTEKEAASTDFGKI